MKTECTSSQLEFGFHGRRWVTVGFDGGDLTSEGGGLLLRETDACLGLMRRLASCFRDWRDASAVEHTVQDLVSQRVYGVALGYEDLNDHDQLRRSSLMALLVGKSDITGGARRRLRDRGNALASPSGLNRLELSRPEQARSDRYKRIAADHESLDRLLVDVFLESHDTAPEEIVLDLDATDDPLHGAQEGRFFHGFYRSYCYLPLYMFCGDHLLLARLRRSNRDASAGTVEELRRIVPQIRAAWPDTRIILRGDSCFAREEIMAWCEARGVDYVFGLARNQRLERRIEKALRKSRRRCLERDEASRRFREFGHRTLSSWSRKRRVVGKAEWLPGGRNPRFVVTSLPPSRFGKRDLYEKLYCARGDMENRIKEQQLDLFADRTSTRTIAGNQMRLYWASFAYVLMAALRRIALAGTRFARAQCGTIRLKLLKIAAQLRITHRRIRLALPSAFPWQTDFQAALDNLARRRRCQPAA